MPERDAEKEDGPDLQHHEVAPSRHLTEGAVEQREVFHRVERFVVRGGVHVVLLLLHARPVAVIARREVPNPEARVNEVEGALEVLDICPRSSAVDNRHVLAGAVVEGFAFSTCPRVHQHHGLHDHLGDGTEHAAFWEVLALLAPRPAVPRLLPEPNEGSELGLGIAQKSKVLDGSPIFLVCSSLLPVQHPTERAAAASLGSALRQRVGCEFIILSERVLIAVDSRR
mmetsp:Transcript_46583/g.110913  ORF Transcript_46583/g.110913 Transcript_46583/m.110913 type:complete len:227 (-) Transcript_46583:339-1019(-)